jgi:uncharacterized protein
MSDRGGSATKVDLRQLRAERGAVLVVACHELVASHIDEIPFPEPVEGTLTLVNLGPVLRVDGRLHTPIDLVCDLCVTRFPYRLEAVVEEELDWGPVPGPRGPRAAASDSDEFLVHAGESVFLDVEALARDALVLALPMVARCSPDCRGLCPQCGANLRLDPCRCETAAETTAADPRLRPLAGWHKDHPSSGSVV